MDEAKTQLKKWRPQWDDDLVDKLNYFWTVIILLICSLTVGMKQYVGSPLQCWVPVEFKRFWEDYAEHYCFVENTYFVPMNETIPGTNQERVRRELGYYQWVPIVLALQAFMFVLPRLLWAALNTHSISVPGVIRNALEIKKDSDKNQRLKGGKAASAEVDLASKYMTEGIHFHQRKPTAFRDEGFYETDKTSRFQRGGNIDPPYRRAQTHRPPKPMPLYGYYTTGLYLLVKLFYVTNVILQFFLLNEFLSPSYRWWGFGILGDLLNGREWHDSGHFPRVTLCDFSILKLGQAHDYTIQCVLVLNMLNEKIYLFLWWWFLLVAVLTALNMVYWISISLDPTSRRLFVSRYLIMRGKIKQTDDAKPFVDRHLRPDGVLLLRLISANAGDIACSNVIVKLWDLYREALAIDPPNSPVSAPPLDHGIQDSPIPSSESTVVYA